MMKKGRPKPGGLLTVWDGEGEVTEHKTFTCCHCGNPKIVPAGRKIEEFADICRMCWRLHCLDEICLSCSPFLRRIEEQEERDYRRRQMEMLT